MVWASEVNGWGKFYDPFMLLNGFLIMPEEYMHRFKETYPGTYSLHTGINPHHHSIESYLEFETPEEEILFRLKYL
jgi:hypothetical protein